MADNTRNARRFTFRLPAPIAERLEQLAAYHGQSAGEELRRAFAIHDARATLAYFDSRDASAEVNDVEQRRSQAEADLCALESRTYRPRPHFPSHR